MNQQKRLKMKKRTAKRKREVKEDSERLQCQLWREWARITPDANPGEEMMKLLELYPPEDE